MRVSVSIALGTLLVAPAAQAADLSINVEVPRINAAEYHRPYVAIWIEDAGQKSVADLAVWYQQTEGKEGHGTKWLPDLRQWWRKSGRSLKVPVVAITLAGFVALYTVLLVVEVKLMLKSIRKGPADTALPPDPTPATAPQAAAIARNAAHG